MKKEDNEHFENSTKCWICDKDYVDNDVRVRDHCYITGKYKDSAHRDYNTNVKLNHKFLSYFLTWKIMIYILLCKN